MISDINKKYKRRYKIVLVVSIVVSLLCIVFSLMIGQYGFIGPINLCKTLLNLFGANFNLPNSYANIIEYIRLPRTIAAFLIGGALSVSGLVYQNTFNNKLVSPDILGVSSGACVGAGIAILIGLNSVFISVFAFLMGLFAVFLSLLLPKLFRNKSTIALVLSGIIIGVFMDSIIGLIKYLADREEKLASITFWMMGSITGVTNEEILYVFPIIIIPVIVLIIMSHRIDVISLGRDEAKSLGVNYSRNRLIIILCSTLLTAAAVSISGNVGWVGLVIPHIARAIVGNRSGKSLPIAFLMGASFMVVVDVLSRTLSKDDIPLSIITGIFGAIIYTFVLIKKGRNIHE